MHFGRTFRSLSAMSCACVLISTLGCGSGGGQSAPYASAVSSLEQHDKKIREAFQIGKPENAHDSLHEVGNILDKFPKLVDSTSLSHSDRDAAKQAADELLDAYTELDLVLHDGEEISYDEVSEKIAANLAVLKDKVAAAGDGGTDIVSPDGQPGHGHGPHGDHSDHDHAHDDHDHAHDEHGHGDAHEGHDHAEHEHEEAAEREVADHDEHAHDGVSSPQ